ncbi:MAG: ABC transporter substrate-binding protein, partial [Comamonadaceae bacterium]
GQRVVMEKFDKYFLEGKPYLDKIILNLSPDTQNLVLGMERGDLHMLTFAAGSVDMKRMKANPKLSVETKGYEGVGAINWLAFNTAKKPLNDVNVRKAIAYAVDKNFITKALMGGFATVEDGPIIASSPFAVPDLVKYPLDLKKSAELLDAAGYKATAGGERLKLTVDYIPGGDEQQKNVAEYLRSQLKKVGIAVEVRASADFPSWARRIAAHDFDMTMDSVYNWADPVIGVHRTYLSTNIKPIIWTNTQSYSNPKVDELLNEAGKITDATKRKAYYASFQKIVTDELPILFINKVPMNTVTSKRVGNVPTTIWGPISPMDDVFLK